MTAIAQPILIAACGNQLAGDDGFGPRVAAEVVAYDAPGVEVLNLGMKPAGLVYHLPDREAVIVVDAAAPDCDHPHGVLLEMEFFATGRPPLRHDATVSSHGLSLAHELEMARQLDILPERVHLIATRAVSTQLGAGLSECVQQVVPLAASRAVQLAQQWLSESHESVLRSRGSPFR